MKKNDYIKKLISELKEIYPDPRCGLDYGTDPWKLLVMARLSAQCTDERVNLTSKDLFAKYPAVKAMADADPEEVASVIRPCGLHNSKARDIVLASKQIIENHNGNVPEDFDCLLGLAGIGRKIANLMVGDVFGKPAIVADTHCIRLSGRLGLVSPPVKDPEKVEKTLKTIIPPAEQNDFCHRLVNLGRDFCRARNPDCIGCPINGICPKILNGDKND